MKQAIIWMPICCTLLFSACKKEETETIQEVVEMEEANTNYYPLQIGSFWIYQTTKHDTIMNTQTDLGRDTVRVVGDTTIMGQHYFAVEENQHPNSNTITSYLTFDNGCIKRLGTSIEVCFGASLDTLRVIEIPSIGTHHVIHQPDVATVTVPAGTFQEVTEVRTDFYTTSNNQLKTGWKIYADGVGIVSQRYFFISTNDFFQRDLVAYSL